MVRRFIPAFVTILLLSGCEEESIQTYRAPKDPPRAKQPMPVAGARRMVSAILPQPDAVWYFKLDGPIADVEAERPHFLEFLQSVKIEAKKPAWKLPEGWSELPASPNRFASIRVRGMELSVTMLGPESGAVLPNVNRWRGQMTLPPIQEADLPKFVTSIDTASGPASLVDLVSTEKAPAPAKKLSYDVPPGWKEISSEGFRVAAFTIEKGSEKAEVTVIPLRGSSGSLIDNVNRWREQVELGPISAEELEKSSQKIPMAGSEARYFDLSGPSRRTLIALLTRGDNTWYFKMNGPTRMLDEHKATFEAFLRSVRFND